MHPTAAPAPLPGALRARAEHFFRADLSEVSLSVDALPASLGALALARGDTIHLAPGAVSLPPPALAELVGHELAHVVQQRQGRVAARALVGGVAVDGDEGLEAEARDLGRRFAHRPDDRPPPAGDERRRGPLVAQRAVAIQGTAVSPTGGLSERARLVLALIDGGNEWFAWASSHPSTRYDFMDEVQLVSMAQQGLHASHLALLPQVGLWVGPAKLMQLRPGDLRTLCRAERGDAGCVAELQTQKVLAENGLRTQADLADVQTFLQEVGLAGNPIMSALGLDAQIAIHDLMVSSKGEIAQEPELCQEAAKFAATQARTPFELVDFYKFYLMYITRLGQAGSASRNDHAVAAVLHLQPQFFDALDAPQMGAPAGLGEVSRVVSSWLAAGKKLGFARLSAGIEQIVKSPRLGPDAADPTKAMVQEYLRDAQTFLAENEPSGFRLGQDGVSCAYVIDGDGARAELHLGPSGVLTLRSFEVVDAPAPLSSPAPPAGLP